jgi:hypothetical protein
MKTKNLIICILIICSGIIRAQSIKPFLEKEVSLNLTNEKTAIVLEKLEQAGGFHFSYPSNLINSSKEISIQVKNKTIRECLLLIFKKEIDFKQKGNYIILQKAKEAKADKVIIKGYVSDSQNGRKIARASVYDKQTLASTTSNDYGYYEIEIPGNKTPEITVNKESYQDTLIKLNNLDDIQNLSIKPTDSLLYNSDSAKLNRALLEVKQLGKEIWLETKSLIHSINIKDTLFRKSQVSFLPFIGTNGALSANVVNDFSFNIIGGVSKGVNELEIGSVLNLVNGNVKGLQISGISNLVNGHVNGIQIAGINNTNRGITNGLQFAGIINLNFDSVKGMQFAGINNINLKQTEDSQFAGMFNLNKIHTKGPEFAGLFNVSEEYKGKLRVAGLFNFSRKLSQSNDFAGLFNIIESSKGNVLAAGLFNVTKDSNSAICLAGLFNTTQIYNGYFRAAGLFNTGETNFRSTDLAGLFNVNKRVNKGVQIAGLANICKENDGIQIAPFNFCKDSYGIPIGVLSFVRNGVHQIEYSRNENQMNEIRLRTGIKKFTNELIAGFENFNTQQQKWHVGYGISSSFKLSNKFNFETGISTYQINNINWNTHVSLLNKLNLAIELRPASSLGIFIGPTMNLFVLNDNSSQYEALKSLVPTKTWINNENNKGVHAIGWFGWRAGIRLF